MEKITQELNIENYDLKSIQNMFSNSTDNNIFYNQYTLLDVEDAKKKVYLVLLRKYNYENKEVIQNFIDNASRILVSKLFTSNEMGNNTEMVGV